MNELLPVIDATDGTQDKETCKRCGGVCCQQAAGIALPSDFGPKSTLIRVLVEYLRTGFWAVDWWEGDIIPGGDKTEVYYIRPAHQNAIGKLRDGSWGGVCRMWSEEYGCSLAFKNRPAQCRNLKPNPPDCSFPKGFSKEDCVLAWRPYQRHIRRAMQIVEESA